MEFRWIQGEDIKILNDIVESQGWSPIPSTSIAFVAFDDEGLAGFHILQMRPHPEPLYVRPDLEGSGLSADLAGAMAQFLKDTNTNGFICIADTPEAEKLCKKFGMQKVSSPVYVRV